MGLTGISEFTFGFAFLHEQTNRHVVGITAVPILPSLQQEADLGWDARLPINGVPNYYQFKLSDYLYRSNATFIKEGPYDSAYYRISLHRRNNYRQHNLLRDLSYNNPDTYYVAPEMNRYDVFNQAFLNQAVVAGSRLIPLSECSYIFDEQPHYITYQAGDVTWHQHSEAIRHERSYLGKEIESLYAVQRERAQRIDRDFAANVWKEQVHAFNTSLQKEDRAISEAEQKLFAEPSDNSRIGFLRAASEIALTVFGATLVIIGGQE